RRRHTRSKRDWSSDVCSSDLLMLAGTAVYPLMLVRLYPVAAGPLVAGYLGLWMLAAAFVACGLFVSALTENQLLAGAATYGVLLDRKSTRLNSSHVSISYAVF